MQLTPKAGCPNCELFFFLHARAPSVVALKKSIAAAQLCTHAPKPGGGERKKKTSSSSQKCMCKSVDSTAIKHTKYIHKYIPKRLFFLIFFFSCVYCQSMSVLGATEHTPPPGYSIYIRKHQCASYVDICTYLCALQRDSAQSRKRVPHNCALEPRALFRTTTGSLSTLHGVQCAEDAVEVEVEVDGRSGHVSVHSVPAGCVERRRRKYIPPIPVFTHHRLLSCLSHRAMLHGTFTSPSPKQCGGGP